MQTVVPGLSSIDLKFQGQPGVIATGVLESDGRLALVDPGPTSCLATLCEGLAEQGLTLARVDAILLTHIHLDHAAATGAIVGQAPHIQVFVHEVGAPHLVDPTQLLASATRLFGEATDRLYGTFVPVPAENLRRLSGGERFAFGPHDLEVAYTPGHASHHVSYFDRSSGVAFVGDTAGIRVAAVRCVLPPTPPPDIDIEAWTESATRIEAWRPQALFLTHFGPFTFEVEHFQELLQRLHDLAGMVRASLAAGETDADRLAWFETEARRYLRRHLSESELARCEAAVPLGLCWMGLARYWKKKRPAL